MRRVAGMAARRGIRIFISTPLGALGEHHRLQPTHLGPRTVTDDAASPVSRGGGRRSSNCMRPPTRPRSRKCSRESAKIENPHCLRQHVGDLRRIAAVESEGTPVRAVSTINAEAEARNSDETAPVRSAHPSTLCGSRHEGHSELDRRDAAAVCGIGIQATQLPQRQGGACPLLIRCLYLRNDDRSAPSVRSRPAAGSVVRGARRASVSSGRVSAR
jgi:hypothetical protein